MEYYAGCLPMLNIFVWFQPTEARVFPDNSDETLGWAIIGYGSTSPLAFPPNRKRAANLK